MVNTAFAVVERLAWPGGEGMARLGSGDFRALLGGLREIYALRGIGEFWPAALRAVRATVPACRATFDAIDSAGPRFTYLTEPPDTGDLAHLDPVFRRHLRDHPLLRRAVHGWDGTALTLSDCLGRAEFRRSALYNEVYRHVD